MTTVGPQTYTAVSIIYDSDAQGLGGAADMTGPVVGEVRYRQDGTGALEIVIDLQFGHPNVAYDVVLTAGASHNLGAGWVIVGQLTTDPTGMASTTVTTPSAVLRQPPFGGGYRSDHIDICQVGQPFTAGIHTAGAMNYFVCARGQTVAEDLDTGNERAPMRGEGDPISVDRRPTSGHHIEKG
jgi:hypothetical protein